MGRHVKIIKIFHFIKKKTRIHRKSFDNWKCLDVDLYSGCAKQLSCEAPYSGWRGAGGGGKPPPTIFFPVASINVGISSKNLLTFVTLLPHLF